MAPGCSYYPLVNPPLVLGAAWAASARATRQCGAMFHNRDGLRWYVLKQGLFRGWLRALMHFLGIAGSVMSCPFNKQRVPGRAQMNPRPTSQNHQFIPQEIQSQPSMINEGQCAFAGIEGPMGGRPFSEQRVTGRVQMHPHR